MFAQRNDDNVSKVCRYLCQSNLRPACRGERAEGERRAGVNHVSVLRLLGSEDASALQIKETLEPATRLNREGISCLHLGHAARYKVPDFTCEGKEIAVVLIILATLDNDDVTHSRLETVNRNAPSHFTRRHVKRLILQQYHKRNDKCAYIYYTPTPTSDTATQESGRVISREVLKRAIKHVQYSELGRTHLNIIQAKRASCQKRQQ